MQERFVTKNRAKTVPGRFPEEKTGTFGAIWTKVRSKRSPWRSENLSKIALLSRKCRPEAQKLNLGSDFEKNIKKV